MSQHIGIVRKRQRSDLVYTFRSSCSQFKEEEEKYLNIKVVDTNSLAEIFDEKYHDVVDFDELQELLLPNFNESKIRSYVASNEDGLSKNQRVFLSKLKLVLLNNDPDAQVSHCEKFIDELASFLCFQADLDNGFSLTMRPCSLRLKVGEEEFASIADREGRRGQQLIWLLQEDKHIKSGTYKHGDLQLACSMIAASQENYKLLEQTSLNQKIVGVKFVGYKINFCCMSPTKEYLKDLDDGCLPPSECVMYKLASLSLCNPADRNLVMKYLCVMRNEALQIPFV
ncbi:hypothetical protein CONCODRAFT_72171 [Conidiobolus coronatus NRRL 28638]|uniref:Uncharacterized protein n=1 Tax=Conidiobolus coronatus (strain ATCC 28846 / CBS 209.66 / NRRL 28638) TaxID=796925 RepID=A0A137P0V5_CONC2|nr:hypothetical protein CONCODRAFT_72171 [Conidiobolus coronatus NRRL 28638]|eukprot:KXN68588.1 hypothetical protein CONCODRAFT_72171 [Conidiobolus coronatus NRRL 28638]